MRVAKGAVGGRRREMTQLRRISPLVVQVLIPRDLRHTTWRFRQVQ